VVSSIYCIDYENDTFKIEECNTITNKATYMKSNGNHVHNLYLLIFVYTTYLLFSLLKSKLSSSVTQNQFQYQRYSIIHRLQKNQVMRENIKEAFAVTSACSCPKHKVLIFTASHHKI
jgi:hypothetical protein